MSQPTTQPGGRRRIDKVLAPDFADDPASLDLAELRARRREAEQEEADLSYVRRMLQGRMDLLRAELSRRSGGTAAHGAGDAALVESLTQVLADPGRGTHGLGRYLSVEPSRVDEHRRLVEQVIADIGISDVSGQTESELRDSLERLAEFEQSISEDRHRVQEVMDRLTTEIAERYKSGAASVDDLLAER